MTIAAAFNFTDGVLICADTKQSAQMRLQASKVFVKEDYVNGIKSVFVYSGDMYSARMGIQHCEIALNQIPTSDVDAIAIRTAVEQSLVNLYQGNLNVYRDPGTYGFDLLAALWSANGDLHTYCSRDFQVM